MARNTKTTHAPAQALPNASGHSTTAAYGALPAPTTSKPAKHAKVALAQRTPDLGTYQVGNKVATANGQVWQVVQVGAQGGTTLKLAQGTKGKAGYKTTFRFARNLTPVS